MIEGKNCMSCMACVEVCPMHCIEIELDENGLEKKIVDNRKCIRCRKCVHVCQLENPISLFEIKQMYVVAPKDTIYSIRSTSSGMATLLSKRFIRTGGVVAGVRWDIEKGASYYIANTEEELENFRGSKYVYPDVMEVYSEIAEIIKTKKVLFIGLPCIIAAVKKYLKDDREKIFYIDLICHGAPQSSFLQEHLSKRGFERLPDQISFRKGEKYILSAHLKKNHYQAEHYNDLYLYGFLNGLIQKEYCFDCRYSYDKRAGDLTLGDAWNQNVLKKERTSLVAINSSKGRQLFESIGEEMYCVEVSLEDFRRNSQQLKGPTKRHKNQEVFKQTLKSAGFEKAAEKALKHEMRVLQLRKKMSEIKNIVRRKHMW